MIFGDYALALAGASNLALAGYVAIKGGGMAVVILAGIGVSSLASGLLGDD